MHCRMTRRLGLDLGVAVRVWVPYADMSCQGVYGIGRADCREANRHPFGVLSTAQWVAGTPARTLTSLAVRGPYDPLGQALRPVCFSCVHNVGRAAGFGS